MGEDYDARQHPRMALYLESLPSGLASYPESQIKAGYCREILGNVGRLPQGLPPPLAELVTAMPPISSWIPEVHHQAIIESIIDEFFPSREAYLTLAYTCQRRLFSHRIYAPILQLVSPQRLLRQAPRRWSNFHRGTTLRVLEEGTGRAVLRIEHPPELFSATGLRSLAGGFRAAVDASRAKECDVLITEHDNGATTYRLRWSV